MRRLGTIWVVLLTIGILVAGLAIGATPHARAQADACPFPSPTSGQAISFTSVSDHTFTAGQDGSFCVTTTDNPTIMVTQGTLPSQVTLSDSGDGYAVLSGTPDRGTGGTYSLIFTAKPSN